MGETLRERQIVARLQFLERARRAYGYGRVAYASLDEGSKRALTEIEFEEGQLNVELTKLSGG